MAPTTRSPADAQTSHGRSRKNATVPMVTAMSMMMTEVHAAGECPWPGSACSVLMLLLRCGVSGASLAVRPGGALAGRRVVGRLGGADGRVGGADGRVA